MYITHSLDPLRSHRSIRHQISPPVNMVLGEPVHSRSPSHLLQVPSGLCPFFRWCSFESGLWKAFPVSAENIAKPSPSSLLYFIYDVVNCRNIIYCFVCFLGILSTVPCVWQDQAVLKKKMDQVRARERESEEREARLIKLIGDQVSLES